MRGPSAISYGGRYTYPVHALTRDEIKGIHQSYAHAAQRALEAGFEWLEMHFAHGYLGASFFSPLANRREDEYGGSLENRLRFHREALDAVWLERLPLTMRLGSDDFNEKGVQFDDAVWAVGVMKEHGLNLADLSLGMNTDDIKDVPFADVAFMVERGSRVRREIGIPVGVSWNLGLPAVADRVIREELIDLVFLGQPALSTHTGRSGRRASWRTTIRFRGSRKTGRGGCATGRDRKGRSTGLRRHGADDLRPGSLSYCEMQGSFSPECRLISAVRCRTVLVSCRRIDKQGMGGERRVSSWKLLLRCGRVEGHWVAGSDGLLPLPLLPLVVRGTSERVQPVEAGERAGHVGSGARRDVPEDGDEPAPVLREMRRASDDQSSDPGPGRCFRRDNPDPDLRPGRSRQLCRDGAADTGWAA